MKPKIIMRTNDFEDGIVEVLLNSGTVVREKRCSFSNAEVLFDWWRNHSTQAELVVLYDATGRVVREWDRSKP